MKVQVIGVTKFYPPDDVPWVPEYGTFGIDNLPEFAGRACYQSWNRPNPATATNKGYIAHIVDVGHFSVLEHSSVSFYVTGVSRSLTHELVRHRHLSYSQLSQRYVPGMNGAVCPDVVREDPEAWAAFADAMIHAEKAYGIIKARLEERFADEPNATARKKKARQAARSVLPNAAETRIVVTGNLRAWRQFIDVRATEHADEEIRVLALLILGELKNTAPSSFQDYRLIERAGVTVATREAE